LFARSVLTTDIRLGCNVHLNVGVTVSHDSLISDYVTLGPGVTCCGGVRIGEEADIGAGAIVLPQVEVGTRTVVGAGAVVTMNLPPNITAVGVPAKALRR
jgi:acetyltransferase-like isoleucine patch superfamily enzyme